MTFPELVEVPGAVLMDGQVQHFGNPLAEQRELAEGQARAVLTDRSAIAVSGPDRLTWLDSITSQALKGLQPGQSTELLVLDPQGRIEHAAGVVDDGETCWLVTEAADAEGFAAWLNRMRFRMQVTVRDTAGEFVVIGGAPEALADLDAIALWHDPWPQIAPGAVGYATADPHPGENRRWAEAMIPVAALADVCATNTDTPALAGVIAVDALRVAAWRPRLRAEADQKALPHESDWLRTAVHMNKGCYRGQETVAKVHNLGHPPRRLVALQLDGSDSVLPSPGATVHAGDAGVGDSGVGVVTSVALHYQDGPIALAYLRRSTRTDAALTVDTEDGPIAAAQQIIVPPDAGATANIPRIPRLGRRPR